MPYDWVDPEVFVEHGGITVYHVYKNDQYQSGARTYWYTTWEIASEDDDEATFDVRGLENPNGHDVETDEGRRSIIRDAIDAGLITQYEE